MPKPAQLKADDETTHASLQQKRLNRGGDTVRIRYTSAARTHELDLAVGGARTTIQRNHLFGDVKSISQLDCS